LFVFFLFCFFVLFFFATPPLLRSLKGASRLATQA
jgi:hypothetical protein